MKNLTGIEFFSFEDETWYKTATGEQRKLTESYPIVRDMFDYISEFYPDAVAKLEEKYSRLKANIVHFRYRIVKAFCRCNFGAIDNVPDVGSDERMRFERVPCPMRGECQMEDIVCNPRFNSKISAAEMRVLELIYRNVRIEDIADRLCLSVHTCKNHRRSAYQRIGVHSTAEFISYAAAHKLFNEE